MPSSVFILNLRARTHLKARLQGSLACRRLDGGNTLIFCQRQKMQIDPATGTKTEEGECLPLFLY